MENVDRDYKVELKCANCDYVEVLTVTKREAAFELTEKDFTCPKCSLTSVLINYVRPELDFELLQEWASNSELFLMPQDEELLLAEERYIDLILKVLDTVPISIHKSNVLMNALCVLIYDITIDGNKKANLKTKSRLIGELELRVTQLESADNSIPLYIRELVFPQLSSNRGR